MKFKMLYTHTRPEASRFRDALHHQIPHSDAHTADTDDECLEPGVRLRKVALSLAGARRSVGDICSQVSLHFLCHGDAAAIITQISVWLTPKRYVLRITVRQYE